MEKTRVTKGFHAVIQVRNETHDVSTLVLTHEFEKNNVWLINHKCDMTVISRSGECILEMEGKKPEKLCMKKRYASIPKGTKYRWVLRKGIPFEGDFVTVPPWTKEQHEVLA